MIKLYLFRPDKTTYDDAVGGISALSAFDAGRVRADGDFTCDGAPAGQVITVNESITGFGTYDTDYAIFMHTGVSIGLSFEIASATATTITCSGGEDISDLVDGDEFEIYNKSKDGDDATHIPLEFETFDDSEGQDIKITRGAGQLAIGIPLRKEKPIIMVFTNMRIGNANEWRVENFLRTISYAKLEWAKKTGKLSHVYFRNNKYNNEWLGWHKYKSGVGFVRFRCFIVDYKKKFDSQGNIFLESLVVEGGWS